MHVVSGVPEVRRLVSGASVGRAHELSREEMVPGPGRTVGRVVGGRLRLVGRDVGASAPVNADQQEYWSLVLGGIVDRLISEDATMREVAASMARIAALSGGASLGWTPEKQAQLTGAMAVGQVIAGMAREALNGQRSVVISDNGSGAWGLAKLPGDPVIVGSDAAGNVTLLDAKTGAPVSATLQNRLGLPANATGIAPVIAIVVGGLAAVAMHATAAAIVYAVYDLAKTTVLTLTDNYGAAKDAECIKANDPKACADFKIAAAEAEKQRVLIQQSRERQLKETLSFGKAVLLVGSGVALGLAALYAFNEAKGLGYVTAKRTKNPAGKAKDTRSSCHFCGAKTWSNDYVGFMRDHDRPDGRKCQQAAAETAEAKRVKNPAGKAKKEQTFRTWEGWKTYLRMSHGGRLRIEGDRDIAVAFDGEHGVGEWDGEKGVIYGPKTANAWHQRVTRAR